MKTTARNVSFHCQRFRWPFFFFCGYTKVRMNFELENEQTILYVSVYIRYTSICTFFFYSLSFTCRISNHWRRPVRFSFLKISLLSTCSVTRCHKETEKKFFILCDAKCSFCFDFILCFLCRCFIFVVCQIVSPYFAAIISFWWK